MPYPYNFFDGVTPGSERVSLCDVVDLPGGLSAKDRMLNWLNATIQDSHFEDLRSYGVDVVRLPVGYWHFITYPGSTTPAAPSHVAERLRNLQTMASPSDYLPYLDRIFNAAAQNGQKIFLELHGAPGSQNGEMHSGCVTSEREKEAYFFEDEDRWNRDMAIAAIEEMSRLCVTFATSCYGVGLLNEPQGQLSFAFLQDYYQRSAAAARRILLPQHYVVAFEWTYNFGRWQDNALPW
jgi:glucan 1,3-beta-glucosidase